ncbi:PIN domain-containing protein, partial [Rhodococcus koreensis]
MSATIVVVDTNAISNSPRLKSSGWKGLIDKSSEWDLQFMVPAVVEMEAVNVVRREWRKVKQTIGQLRVGEFGLSTTLDGMSAAIGDQLDGYEAELRELLNRIGATVVPTPDADHLEIARRASERRAPYVDRRQDKSKGNVSSKDGYRDTLIWLTVLDIARSNPDCEVWFVSANHTDFGLPPSKDQAISEDACPYPLHPELLEDLSNRGVAEDRVLYVRTLERLEQHLAAQFAALSGGERDALVAKIDTTKFDRYFSLQVATFPLDPEQAALPLGTVEATIQSLPRTASTVRFDEAARRAAGSWTALITTLVEPTIEITNSVGNVEVIDKKLQVFGRVAISAEGAVEDMVVTAIEALPEDPMRRAWQRRLSNNALDGFR